MYVCTYTYNIFSCLHVGEEGGRAAYPHVLMIVFVWSEVEGGAAYLYVFMLVLKWAGQLIHMYSCLYMCGVGQGAGLLIRLY